MCRRARGGRRRRRGCGAVSSSTLDRARAAPSSAPRTVIAPSVDVELELDAGAGVAASTSSGDQLVDAEAQVVEVVDAEPASAPSEAATTRAADEEARRRRQAQADRLLGDRLADGDGVGQVAASRRAVWPRRGVDGQPASRGVSWWLDAATAACARLCTSSLA